MTILVCGSRDWFDAAAIAEVLAAWEPDRLVHGDARGVDRLAGQWAQAVGVPVTTYPAQWDEHGTAAGALRNQQMLHAEQPDLVIAFDLGTPGTADMIRRAEAAGVPWIRYTPDDL